LSGEAEVTLGANVHRPAPGSTVFIPPGVWHRHRNVGDGVLRIAAVFPATVVDMDMAERNPAPGTEDDSPAHTVYDLRSGNFWPADDEPPSS
ncbi:MAG TPA: cupin domain-containing protein, partial [Actinomycetota bacterium]|nr:cupin domain-containing protein [Actinomycetota bacterium]